MSAPYAWQAGAWAHCVKAFADHMLPTAWLIQGPKGQGQADFAMALHAGLLCAKPEGLDSCGSCDACEWVRADTHPDAWVLAPNPQGTITIDMIRALNEALSHSALRGRKVVSISCPEAMTTAAANAFLKMLEEPPGDTCLVLNTHAPDRLLPTIRSRCVVLALGKAPLEASRDWLVAQGVADPDFWLGWAYGAPCAAKAWAGTLTRVQIADLLADFDGLCASQQTPVQFYARWQPDLPFLRAALTHALQAALYVEGGRLGVVPTPHQAPQGAPLWTLYDAWLELDADLNRVATEGWLADWQLACLSVPHRQLQTTE